MTYEGEFKLGSIVKITSVKITSIGEDFKGNISTDDGYRYQAEVKDRRILNMIGYDSFDNIILEVKNGHGKGKIVFYGKTKNSGIVKEGRFVKDKEK